MSARAECVCVCCLLFLFDFYTMEQLERKGNSRCWWVCSREEAEEEEEEEKQVDWTNENKNGKQVKVKNE